MCEGQYPIHLTYSSASSNRPIPALGEKEKVRCIKLRTSTHSDDDDDESLNRSNSLTPIVSGDSRRHFPEPQRPCYNAFDRDH